VFYFYYPAELESLLGPATVSIKTSDENIANVELLKELTIEPGQNNCYLFYPTLSSLLSHSLFDSNLRTRVTSCFEDLSKKISDLKKKNKSDLICVGISVVSDEEISTALNSISYKVSFATDSCSLERMLAEYFISKSMKLKKMVGAISAISQFVEEMKITESEMESELNFISDSLFIKSNFGDSSDIASSQTLLDDKSKLIAQLSQKFEELEKQHLTVVENLNEQITSNEVLKKDHERAIHQIQVLQESIVDKHQEFSLKKSELEGKYLNQISKLNSENDELLGTLKKLEDQKLSFQQKFENSISENQKLKNLCEAKSLDITRITSLNETLEIEKVSTKQALDSSIKEIQKLHELYEANSLKNKKLTTLNGELVKENKVLAAKILDVNEEQMNLSLSYTSFTEQAEKDRKQAIAKQKVLERELTRLKARNAEVTHKYSSLRYQMFCTNRELELIQSSPFWKGSRLLKNLKSKLNKNKISESVKADIALIATSEYFDFDWYLDTYSDVEDANVDPAQHYLIAGAEEGRLPGPNFDGNWYLERYPDVAEAQINPLLHYIKCGKREGRVPSPKMLADKRKI